MEKVSDSHCSVCGVQNYTQDYLGRTCKTCGGKYPEQCPNCYQKDLLVDKSGAYCNSCEWASWSGRSHEIFIFNDGGREAAGFKGSTNDCVVRAIAIATDTSYKEVYNSLTSLAHEMNNKKGRRKMYTTSPRLGVDKDIIKEYLTRLGWKWTALMKIGSGCKTHLRKKELPSGKIICSLSKHYVAVINGFIQDTYDSTRGGKRCVYGYWSKGV